jgi:hypothetical protein
VDGTDKGIVDVTGFALLNTAFVTFDYFDTAPVWGADA